MVWWCSEGGLWIMETYSMTDVRTKQQLGQFEEVLITFIQEM